LSGAAGALGRRGNPFTIEGNRTGRVRKPFAVKAAADGVPDAENLNPAIVSCADLV
jgi:hypothetical protein